MDDNEKITRALEVSMSLNADLLRLLADAASVLEPFAHVSQVVTPHFDSAILWTSHRGDEVVHLSVKHVRDAATLLERIRAANQEQAAKK